MIQVGEEAAVEGEEDGGIPDAGDESRRTDEVAGLGEQEARQR